jgi:hypothetical protein
MAPPILKPGDLVFVPNNTLYFDEGHLTMLSFSQPRFTPGQVASINNP